MVAVPLGVKVALVLASVLAPVEVSQDVANPVLVVPVRLVPIIPDRSVQAVRAQVAKVQENPACAGPVALQWK